ncbi:nucleolar protein dao-5 isoform X2 [Manduca sexta]|uniref:nucleolar protein dao-5 isoform X2 n=1 Tax=Manduca sexta TaxID=7130 RepID=UPI00189073D4|nr:nucleolar protein dao-5 isoform X2 [Manduca sexta]
MSDIEEPPSKVLKLEISGAESVDGVDGADGVEEHLDPEEEEDNMEEGQEEWLSEGVLTDDDYNPGGEQEAMEAHPPEMLEESRTADDATPSLESSTEQVERLEALDPADTHDWLEHTTNAQHGMKDDSSQGEVQQKVQVNGKGQESQSQDSIKKEEQDMEDTLNDLDRRYELPEDLDAFLIRKSDGQVVDKNIKTQEEPATAPAPAGDDGNDTDDLLRMLGEEDSKVKKKMLVKKSGAVQNDMLSSDDEFTYEDTKVKTLKVAKSVLMKKRPATKAVPEAMSDDSTDASSDEAATVKKMFAVAPKKSAGSNSAGRTLPSAAAKPPEKPAPASNTGKPTAPAPPKQYVNKNLQSKPSPRPFAPSPSAPAAITNNSSDRKSQPVKMDTATKPKPELKSKPLEKSDSARDSDVKMEVIADARRSARHHDEIIDEEEFLEEEEDYDLDEEEFAEESESEPNRNQRIMRPERMDEELPSDAESHTEDGSLYDEIPSSDSEDLDDWFSLDVRAERAGDYLPLLGSKARTLLLEEKRRVSARLSTLRQSLSALTDSGRRQAEQLRRATMTLAELDDMLKAT